MRHADVFYVVSRKKIKIGFLDLIYLFVFLKWCRLLFGKGYFHRGNHSGLVLAFSWWHLGCSDCNFADF